MHLSIIAHVNTRHGIKYIEMYLNTNTDTLEGFKYKYKYNYEYS